MGQGKFDPPNFRIECALTERGTAKTGLSHSILHRFRETDLSNFAFYGFVHLGSLLVLACLMAANNRICRLVLLHVKDLVLREGFPPK